MSNVAIAVGNMAVATSVEALVACPKGSQSTGKGGGKAFADAEPLVKLRDELRSHKKPLGDSAQSEDVAQTQPIESEGEPAESAPRDEGDAPQWQDPTIDSAVAQTASVAVVLPLEENVVAVAQPEVVGTPVAKEAPDTTAIVDHQQSSETLPVVSDTSEVLPQTHLTATVEPGEAEGDSASIAGIPTAGQDGAKVAEQVLVADQTAGTQPSREGAPATAMPASEGHKAPVADSAPATVEVQTGGSVETQAKVAPAATPAEPLVAAEAQVVAKTQQAAPQPAQPPAEGPKGLDADTPAAAARATVSSEESTDTASRDNGQSLPRQAGDTPQAAATIATAGTKEKEAAPLNATEASPPSAEPGSSSQYGLTDAVGRMAAQVSGSAGAETGSVRSAVQDISDQILSSIHASIARADKQVQIRLDPPELGSVLVRVQETGDQIRGMIEVARDETRREIEQALPQVLRGLQEAGVQVRRLEVVVSDQPDRGLGREQSQQDAWAQQQQESARQGYRPQYPSGSFRSSTADLGWLQRGPSAVGDGQSGLGEGPYGRINMLM